MITNARPFIRRSASTYSCKNSRRDNSELSWSMPPMPVTGTSGILPAIPAEIRLIRLLRERLLALCDRARDIGSNEWLEAVLAGSDFSWTGGMDTVWVRVSFSRSLCNERQKFMWNSRKMSIVVKTYSVKSNKWFQEIANIWHFDSMQKSCKGTAKNVYQ